MYLTSFNQILIICLQCVNYELLEYLRPSIVNKECINNYFICLGKSYRTVGLRWSIGALVINL